MFNMLILHPVENHAFESSLEYAFTNEPTES